jgi:hypothetical protein
MAQIGACRLTVTYDGLNSALINKANLQRPALGTRRLKLTYVNLCWAVVGNFNL